MTRKDFGLPDLTFVSEDRLDIVQSKGIYGAPNLVVDILSPGRANAERDRVERFHLYEQFGVKEYWIVNPYEETIDLFVLSDGRYSNIGQSRVLEGFEWSCENIFE